MTAYADTSVLVSAFTRDDHTERIRAWLRTAPALIVSDWTAAEFSAAVRRQVRVGRLAKEGVASAEHLLDTLVRDARSFRHVLTEDLVDARRLVVRHEPLRAPDALHLAVARRLSISLATLDLGQARAARAEGLDVVDL